MLIDRKELVQRHNPKLRGIDTESPISVGNGEFAFTADITGFQSLYTVYSKANAPLCTMSHWGWHSAPASNGRGLYTLDDVDMTEYKSGGRDLRYAVECKPGNEDIYHWLRHNPHRLNLARIALLWNGRAMPVDGLSDVMQELDLYTGVLHSEFKIYGRPVRVQTVCARGADAVGFLAESDALASGELTVGVFFPYGSHHMDASCWSSEKRHTTDVVKSGGGEVVLKRTLDGSRYFAGFSGNTRIRNAGAHRFILEPQSGELNLTAAFSPDELPPLYTFDEALGDSTEGWAGFWQGCGVADFSRSKDPRAMELERRMVLSQYLTALHSAGSLPPQETGLACNSWYGKFHLEMHILHSGWLPLWNHGELLEKSFDWYLRILDNARANAARNGYRGARWPKMTGPEGLDSPSPIATLLIWQQPHILYMLELARRARPEAEWAGFMDRYWEIVRETADFMVSFTRFNEETGVYDLHSPLIPAQEEHAPDITENPAFELCYWRFGLALAADWAGALGKDHEQWLEVRQKLAAPPISGGVYTAHKNCPDTFESFNRDHPSMLYGFGFIPCDGIDKVIMSDTFDKVAGQWDFSTMWGWDFALMAMTLTRLGRPEEAVDILLKDTAKNSYVASGNNYQKGRSDLPLYLPGNGSLLLALSMMLAGYGGKHGMPGLPKNGMWDVEFEGISPLPY